jgi:5'-3' exonuclease
MKTVYLIIDGNNISFRASSVIPSQKLIDEDVNTGLLWGMLNKRIRIIKESGVDNVIPVFTFDAPHDAGIINDALIDRYQFDVHYKENRRDDGTDPKRTDLDAARNRWRQQWINELMDREHILIQYPGTEADDFMAYAASRLSESTDSSLIGSGIWTMDKDLMQCINDANNVFMYRYVKGRDITVDETEVLSEKGVPASKIRLQLALQGDAADNYAKVKGYGGKKGLELIKQSDGIDDLALALPEFKEQLFFNWTLAGVGTNYMPSGARTAADFAIESALSLA